MLEVKLTPQPPGEDAVLGRLTLEKAFHGDLEATSSEACSCCNTAGS